MGKENLNRLVLPSGASIRQAFPYDFAVGIDETGMTDMRIAIQTQAIPTESNDPQRMLHVFSRQAHPDGSCSPALAWSQPATALIKRGASAFQPVMAVRHGQSSGSVWSMAYLTTADVSDPTKDYVRVEARQLIFLKQTIGGIETFVPFPGIPIIMSPKSSWVCSTTGGYWGDYFGIAYHRDIRGALHLTSAFSSSGLGEQVCAIKAPLVASPLHVESATF